MFYRFIVIFLCIFFSLQIQAQSVQSKQVIVSGPSSYLVETVQNIYKEGGNIFDAAVAGAFSLSVTHPYFVSLGCGGFAILKNYKNIQALDFREIAPSKMREDFYVGSGLSPRREGTAVGVPGFVAGLSAIHKKHGSIKWARLLQPAIKLAKKGFIVSGQWHRKSKKYKDEFNSAGKKIFFQLNEIAYLPGEILKQPLLAKALRRIAQKNKKSFYEGRIGKDIIQTVNKHKGVMTEKDLQSYRVRWLKPLSFSFGGYDIHSMPLPSSGGIILSRLFKLVQFTNMNTQPLYGLDEWHLLGEILNLSFRPRSQMGDLSESALYLKQWLSDKKLKNQAKKISFKEAKTWSSVKDTKKNYRESSETTHFSLMDDKGQAVSMTLTLNGNFGSFVVSEKYGIVLNNQMDDFNTQPGKPNQFGLIQGMNNKVAGGRRPLSSMTPVVVEKQGKTVMVAGGSGGPMIISSVFQVLYRYLISGLSLDLAIQAPRMHHQFLPGNLYFEKNRFSPLILNSLKKKGHQLKERDSIAKVYAVAKGKQENAGLLEGSFDARGEGSAGGL